MSTAEAHPHQVPACNLLGRRTCLCYNAGTRQNHNTSPILRLSPRVSSHTYAQSFKPHLLLCLLGIYCHMWHLPRNGTRDSSTPDFFSSGMRCMLFLRADNHGRIFQHLSSLTSSVTVSSAKCRLLAIFFFQIFCGTLLQRPGCHFPSRHELDAYRQGPF